MNDKGTDRQVYPLSPHLRDSWHMSHGTQTGVSQDHCRVCWPGTYIDRDRQTGTREGGNHSQSLSYGVRQAVGGSHSGNTHGQSLRNNKAAKHIDTIPPPTKQSETWS